MHGSDLPTTWDYVHADPVEQQSPQRQCSIPLQA